MKKLLALVFVVLPLAAQAFEAPPGQAPVDKAHILRGHFVEQRQSGGDTAPLQTSGHFAVAPAYGLLWGLEQPFPTTTVITPKGAAQRIGDMSVKLPVKNLEHLYDLVGGALAGNWDGLQQDFVVTRGHAARGWQLVLTPRAQGQPSPYASISVGGGKFIETITLAHKNGATENFAFSDQTLSSLPATAQEMAAFQSVRD